MKSVLDGTPGKLCTYSADRCPSIGLVFLSAEPAAETLDIDFDLINSLYRGQVDQPDWAKLARRAEPPTAVRLRERASPNSTTPLGFTPDQARQRGVQALRAG